MMDVSSGVVHKHLATPYPSDSSINGHSPPTAGTSPMSSKVDERIPVSQSTDLRPQFGGAQANGHSTYSTATPEDGPIPYAFPRQRLRRQLEDSSKTPLVLVACGSFSPITYLHLRMFEMVADHVRFNTNFEIVGGYLSPVSDAYKKAGLASALHRVRMCEIAANETSNWLMVDPWEANLDEYTRTALVLDHFDHEINIVQGGVETDTGERKRARIALLAGADLIGTMSTPGVWSESDLDHILGRYGAFIVERTGTDIDEALAHLQSWKENIYVIPQLIQNDVSSTKIRHFLRKEMSVQYLIPAAVIQYIERHGLYEDDGKASSTQARAKEGKGRPPNGIVEAENS